jgi:hypothetical protein
LPAIDFLENSNLIYKEDFENMSPLKDINNVKVIQISYSSIAAVCNTSKTNVMNCLKEIFSNMLFLIKQGSEITLDIKIGIVQVMRDNKLMFRNYNPDIKIKHRRNASQVGTFSERSAIPTSVATPMTNMNSTLSYRGQSQDMARNPLNHVGIKRSGPAHEYNAEIHYYEGEKIYYRHKKNPYNHLESFINDERFEIENKIQEIRLKERQMLFNNKKKNRRSLSNSFHSNQVLQNKNKIIMNKSSQMQEFAPHQTHTSILNRTAIIKSQNGDDFIEEGPSTVNEKLTSKFVIDYPNFLKPAKYHPYRRLEEYHIADVLEDARKRYEDKLLQKKSEDTQYDTMFFKNVDEGKKVLFTA